MKPFYYIILMLLTCVFAQDALSQTQTPQRRQTPRQSAEAGNNNLPALSVRAAAKNADQTKDIENMIWLREIYRWVDLRKENNSPLYYPQQPIGERMNLFTIALKLVTNGSINGYRYLIDRDEIFTDEYKVEIADMLQNLNINYTTQGTGAQTKYIIENSDIPSNEALMYSIKEVYYFDQATGMYGSKVVAICPMLIREEYSDSYSDSDSDLDSDSESDSSSDYDLSVRPIPLFWLNYEDIRPYISKARIMTSNYNNALTYTIDDFFNKNMYSGYIVKTTNMMNRSLSQEVGGDPVKLKLAQDSIENQLKRFEVNLWVPKDTTTVAKKGSKTVKKADNKKEEKPKETKVETGPTKSVRRTR